jgi:acyl-CoA synthetase (AMP-forming)/AMP-acid ligase II
MPCDFLSLVREHILRHHRDNPALTTSERSLYGSSTCSYGELLDRATKLKEILDRLTGHALECNEPSQSSWKSNQTATHVVICGDGPLHAVATLACSLAGLAAVYVPNEATIGETVNRTLIVQRASQAAAIIFNEHVWREAKGPAMERCAPVARGVFPC